MGVDKALLHFCGRPLVELAVEKVATFCNEVSIVGREDLDRFAPIARDERINAGPAAGMEAGLRVASQPWTIFIPVDVPLVPAELLRAWTEETLGDHRGGFAGSTLLAQRRPQPAFCLLRRECLRKVTAALDSGLRSLRDVLGAVDDSVGDTWLDVTTAERLIRPSDAAQVEFWFQNLNTPQQFEEAEMWVRSSQQ